MFILAELDNFPALLHRLGRVHSLFTHPHPLCKVANQQTAQAEAEDNCSTQPLKEDSLVSMQSFHKKFLNYLVENRFYSMVYHYLDTYG